MQTQQTINEGFKEVLILAERLLRPSSMMKSSILSPLVRHAIVKTPPIFEETCCDDSTTVGHDEIPGQECPSSSFDEAVWLSAVRYCFFAIVSDNGG
mmetsp:Transcript_31313/g.46469  ORF Transcript_31313/g.46469 Transcript_31313/m.46469 type:complete len:97 (+) Transcript_31313:793-1083(+)